MESRFIRMCASKRFYRTEGRALRAKKKCERSRPGTKLRIYACPFCLGWHLTKQSAPPAPAGE